jgi:ATP-dependent DNA ligase
MGQFSVEKPAAPGSVLSGNQHLDRPPSVEGWIHEIKFDGYRIQMRVLDGEVTLKTRRGLDWTTKYPAIARAAGSLPDAIIDGEICALDENGAPDFAALQAALSEGKTDSLVYFAFDLLFDGGEDLRTRPLTDRKERLQQRLADADDNTAFASLSISRLVGRQCCARPAGCRLKESFRSVAMRPTCLDGRTRG